ncbi:MAG TPA: OmpP1/FadL family transporter [Gammaproteobacteria bacterium]|nr:OmpP1/FadL family transporter [Gammaproteobacteria bacterium]
MSSDVTLLDTALDKARYIATGLLLCFTSQQAFAGSFQLHEQSVTYLGNAFSGTASTAEDASTGYYNPAGLPLLKNPQIVVSGIYYHGTIKLYNAHATNNLGANVASNPTSWPVSSALVPGVHLSANINKNWSVGIGVVAPFGLSTKYNSTSIARYMATKSEIQTIDITPSVAYKINCQWSVGAGFDAMHVKTVLDSDIFFGSEGYVKNNGHAWTYGYHLGVLFQASKDTRMGLVYYSLFNPHIHAKVSTLGYPSASKPTSSSSTVNLPDRIVYSITHMYSDQWTGVGDVEWVHWSRLQSLTVNYNNNTATYIPMFGKNTWRVSLGANYKYSECLLFKGGIAYDESPIRTVYRIAPLPDSDRYWIALGVKYKVYKQLSFDVAYAHLFFKKCSIQETGTVNGVVRQTLYGNYKSSADLVGIQLTWNFV